MSVQFRTVCSVCKLLQIATPSGPSCINGHGGAPGEMKTLSDPLTKQERQWIDSCIPKCSCGANLARDRVEAAITCCPRCEPPDPDELLTVRREDLQALLDDASNSYHYADFPDHALRIRSALED